MNMDITLTKVRLSYKIQSIYFALIVVASIALIYLSSLYLPQGIDWRDTYRPAALELLTGKSPYNIDIYFAAPWALIPVIPFALLPESIGRAAWFVLSICFFGFVAVKLGASRISLLAFLLSPPIVHCLLNGNIEWIPLLGFVLPPQIGIFFLAVKPQIGFGVALFLIVDAWRRGKLGEVARIFAPFSIVLLLSFLAFGLWPLRFQKTITLTEGYNASLWPLSIPVGLALLIASLRSRDVRFSMPAGPCLSPYVLFHAWSGALLALIGSGWIFLATVAGLWSVVITRLLTGF